MGDRDTQRTSLQRNRTVVFDPESGSYETQSLSTFLIGLRHEALRLIC